MQKYIDTIYDGQIMVDGSQPLELARQFSLHYSYYNLEALGVMAKYAQSVGMNIWNTQVSFVQPSFFLKFCARKAKPAI